MPKCPGRFAPGQTIEPCGQPMAGADRQRLLEPKHEWNYKNCTTYQPTRPKQLLGKRRALINSVSVSATGLLLLENQLQGHNYQD